MTDKINQQLQWVTGIFTLFSWLYFNPSGWHKFMQQIDDLKSDFCLIELTITHLKKHPQLLKIMVQGYVLLPVFSAAIIGLIGYILNFETPVFAFIAGFSFGIITTFAFGMVKSAIVGMAGSPLLILSGYILFSNQSVNIYSVAILCFALGTLSNMMIYFRQDEKYSLVLGEILLGLITGLIGVLTIFGIPVILAQNAVDNTLVIATMVLFGTTIILLASFNACDCECCLSKCQKKCNIAFWSIVFIILSLIAIPAFGESNTFANISKGIVYAIALSACLALPYVIVKLFFDKDSSTFNATIAGTIASVLIISLLISFGSTLLESTESEEAITFSQTSFFIVVGIISCGLGLSFHWWSRVVLFPFEATWNSFIYALDDKQQPKLVLRNAAFWDELQWLPLQGLQQHLRLFDIDTSIEIIDEHLKNSSQNWVIDELIVSRDVQLLTSVQSLEQLKNCHQKLNTIETNANWLQQFCQISLHFTESLKHQAIHDQLGSLKNVLHSVAHIIENSQNAKRPYHQYEEIAKYWHEMILAHKNKLDETTHNIIKSPYVLAKPLDSLQQTFIGRTDLVQQLNNLLFERQVSVFLYGTYRIGKTSLLKNLIALFGHPQQVVALFVDLQGAVAIGGDMTGFFEYIASNMKINAKKNYDITLPAFSVGGNPYADFNHWLSEIQSSVLAGKKLILLLDEFANLNQVAKQDNNDFDYQRLDNLFRYWIQNQDDFQFIISSQCQTDIQSWTSLTNSIVAVPISYLTEAESRQLIEAPVKDFALQYEPEATQTVLKLTRGHPALIQLLCANVISLKNSQELEKRFIATVDDVNRAADTTLKTAMSVFGTIVNHLGEQTQQILKYVAQQNTAVDLATLETQQFDQLKENVDKALQLGVIEKTDAGYQFQVELMRRYFATI